MKGSGRWGEIDHTDKVIRINFSAITPMSKGNEWGFPASTADEFFALVFAHELLHKVTITKEKSPELMRLFDVFVSEYSGNSTMTKYTKDINEFLSGLFTDKNLQAKLNQVKVGERSLFDKIWDAIKKMISGDIEVKPGSLLERSMEEAFKLIAPESKKSTEESGGVQSESKYLIISYPKDIFISKEIGYIEKTKLDEIYNVFSKTNPFGTDKFDSETVADQRAFEGLRNISNRTDKFKNPLTKYEMTDQQYLYAKKNAKIISELLIISKEGLGIDEIITNILNENKRVKDSRQLSLFDEDVQSLLEFNFSDTDMKEAEEVDKYCNGKFGKIKK